MPTVGPQSHNLVESIYLNPQGKFQSTNHVHKINNTSQCPEFTSGSHFYLRVMRPSRQGYNNKTMIIK